ncbi:MAG: hypothetical protein ACD_75C00137G0001 [uncultured bacterium]|nr:MAG: hypothetical protein ACD_75C00137G0001 [uncultured bacterium]
MFRFESLQGSFHGRVCRFYLNPKLTLCVRGTVLFIKRFIFFNLSKLPKHNVSRNTDQPCGDPPVSFKGIALLPCHRVRLDEDIIGQAVIPHHLLHIAGDPAIGQVVELSEGSGITCCHLHHQPPFFQEFSVLNHMSLGVWKRFKKPMKKDANMQRPCPPQ